MIYVTYNMSNIKIRCFEILIKKFASQMDADTQRVRMIRT